MTTVIEPDRPSLLPDVAEIWRFRGVLYFLGWRDVKVRYTQATIGAAWAIIQPVLLTGVFAIFFGKLAGVPTEDGAPYAVFAYVGLLPWTYFAAAIVKVSLSLEMDANLISRVYFPRLLIPLSALAVPLADLLVAASLALVVVPALGAGLSWRIIFLPAMILFATVVVLAFAIPLAALNVAYRDVRQVVPFAVQAGLFVTPVIYPARLVVGPFAALYGLNPMVGVVEAYRWTMYGSAGFPTSRVLTSLAVTSVLLLLGLRYFRRVQRYFADVI